MANDQISRVSALKAVSSASGKIFEARCNAAEYRFSSYISSLAELT